jgi:hypothetical protein
MKKRKMMKMMKRDYMMMKKMKRRRTMYTMRELSTQIAMMLMQVNLTAQYQMVGTKMEQSITMMITSCMQRRAGKGEECQRGKVSMKR